MLAQTKGELGNPEVETMLKRLASWSLEKFSAHMDVSCIFWGHVTYPKDDSPSHLPPTELYFSYCDFMDDKWALY